MSAKSILFKLIILVIVIIIWISHSLLKIHNTEVELPLGIFNLNSGLIAIGDGPETITVSVEASGLDINSLRRHNAYVEINAEEAQTGLNTFSLSEHNIIYKDIQFRNPVNFQLNKTINIEFDEIDKKTVIIEKRFLTLEDELFFNQRNATIKPETVEIEGAKSLIAAIFSVRTTPISSESIEKSRFDIDLEIPEDVINSSTETVEIILEAPVVTIRTIPLIRINYPDDRGIIIIPQYVTVQIEGVADIVHSVRPNMINAYIENPEVYVNSFAPITFDIPETIKITKHTPRRVQVIPEHED